MSTITERIPYHIMSIRLTEMVDMWYNMKHQAILGVSQTSKLRDYEDDLLTQCLSKMRKPLHTRGNPLHTRVTIISTTQCLSRMRKNQAYFARPDHNLRLPSDMPSSSGAEGMEAGRRYTMHGQTESEVGVTLAERRIPQAIVEAATVEAQRLTGHRLSGGGPAGRGGRGAGRGHVPPHHRQVTRAGP